MWTRTVLFIWSSFIWGSISIYTSLWIILITTNLFCMSTSSTSSWPIDGHHKNENGQYSDIHKHLTHEERIVLLGHHIEVPKYQVISPESLWIHRPHYHRLSKRSIGSYGNLNQPIKVEFEAFDEAFRLRLWPNHGLLSPGFHLTNQQAGKESNESNNFQHDWSTRKQLLDCFYQGYDEAHEDSAAAISLCNGMQGVIETKPSIYMINPVPQATSDRIFATSNKNNSATTQERYHLVLKKTDFNHYQCPHGPNHQKHQNDLKLFITNSNNNGNTKERMRTKRSIDIAASNRNFLDADKTTTTTTPRTSISNSNSTTTIDPPTLLSESINEIVDDNTTNHHQHTPTFNITVETAVFVDESLYHVLSKTFPIDTEQQIVLYVLTIMNAVQLLFKQPSIGRSVDISVVLMDLLRQQPKNLIPSDNIDTYLTNFCVWQHKKRLRESGGPTPDWDHALLLSGINMYVVDGYGRRKRHVVGLAPVSGMCNSLNSCTISEGTNFQTVLVAGHEMGHSLGMEHDGSQDGNSCNKDDFVMSPTLGPGKTTWSECSKNYLNKFVLTPQATCILGRSSHVNIIHQFIPAHRLPGEQFNVDDQCQFRFGPTARHHSSQHKSEICRVIKCFVKSSSASKHGFYSGRGLYPYPVKSTYNTHPALEGSECGLEKWCREGRCVPKPSNSYSVNTFNDIDEKNLIVTIDRNHYVTLDLNITTPHKITSARIANRHKKRPTAKPKPTVSNGWHNHNTDPYHYKLSDQTVVTSATVPSMTSSTSIQPPVSVPTQAPSTVLIVDNIYKKNIHRSNDSLNSIDTTNAANYVSDDQYNPYNRQGKDLLARNHGPTWSSNRLSPVNGNWSEWSNYGPCISECVAPGSSINSKFEVGASIITTMVPLGVQTSLRRCNNPSPMNGGQECFGPDTRVKLCNAIKACSAASATSAASGVGAKHRTKLDGSASGKRYQIRSVDEYISDTCLLAAKLNDKIENHGTQYPSYDSESHSCFVWCYKRGGGFMTQGWRLPDGTPCGRKMARTASSVVPSNAAASVVDAVSKHLIEISGYCFNGQCRRFNCRGEIFHRQSISSTSSSTNVYNGGISSGYKNQSQAHGHMLKHQEHKLLEDNCPATYRLDDIINELEDQIDDSDTNNYDSTYRLVQKVKLTTPLITSNSLSSPQPIITGIVDSLSTISPIVTQNPYITSNNWSDWHPVTECQYSIACIHHGRGFRLVTRECRRQTCLGRREALQVCPDITDVSSVSESSTTMYKLYEQYCPISIRRSADEYAQAICRKYQIKFSSLLSGNGRQLNRGCIVACEDRLWKDIHYQMDAFNDGKFPFGTDCSTKERLGYCLNGKCIHFDHSGVSYDTSESVLYRNEILRLFAPSTIFPIEPTNMYGSFTDNSRLRSEPLSSDNSLYSAIFNQEIYKRATKSNMHSVEYQPAYQSFISSRRFKRDLSEQSRRAPPEMFRKATIQEQTDPEGDYVSWSMLRHHHPHDHHHHHHRQYRRPITRTMKKSSTFPTTKIDWSPLVLKPLRPIKLTSVSRKRKLSSSSNQADSHFQTFTLVKPLRRKNHPWISKPSSPLGSEQIGIPLAKNHTTFLDDDEDDDHEFKEEQYPQDEPKTNVASSGNTSTIKIDSSSQKKQKAKFGLGHESWPPITYSLQASISTKSHNDDNGNPTDQMDNHNVENDDYNSQSDQLRVEPYVWSVILSECNRPCGEGVRTVRVVCTVGQKSVREHFCDQQSKPIHKPMESCKQRDCIGKWRSEPWSQCFSISNRCNQTNSGSKLDNSSYQSRTIACVGPMIAYEHYELSTRWPGSQSLSTKATNNSNMNKTNRRNYAESPRIFSLLSHEHCDPLTKPSQWRPCEPNALVAVKCNDGST